MKNHELVAQLQLPEGKAARLRKGQIVIVSVSPKAKETKKVEKQPTTLQFTVRPWGCNNESVLTSNSAIRFADKDSRLSVKKEVLGKWGKNSTAISYTIVVPVNYPDQISIVAKYDRKTETTVLYSPNGTVDQLLPRNK